MTQRISKEHIEMVEKFVKADHLKMSFNMSIAILLRDLEFMKAENIRLYNLSIELIRQNNELIEKLTFK